MGSILLGATAWAIVANNQWLLKIFCVFGWHSWEYTKGGKRECKHCKKRQILIRVGNDTDWK